MSDKRKDYLSWDEYFMGVAILAGMRSKDPNTQVGACIVSQSNRILSVGYNGFPNGVSDDEFPWVTLFPCNECAKAIIQSGIRTVIYDSNKYADVPAFIASKRMFDSAGVELVRYRRSGREISMTL